MTITALERCVTTIAPVILISGVGRRILIDGKPSRCAREAETGCGASLIFAASLVVLIKRIGDLQNDSWVAKKQEQRGIK